MEQKTYTKQLLIGLTALAVLMIGLRFWTATRPTDPVSSFAECAAQDGSVIQESYPEVCVTAQGEQFVAEVLEPTIFPSPTPNLEPLVYENEWYQIAYPVDWQLLDEELDSELETSLTSWATNLPATDSATLAIAVNRTSDSLWETNTCTRLAGQEPAELSEAISGTVELFDLGMLVSGECTYQGTTGVLLRFSAQTDDYIIAYIQDSDDAQAAADFEDLLLSFELNESTSSAVVSSENELD